MSLKDMIANNVWHHLSDVLPTLKAASRGHWTWYNNFRCKYIELRIDMRDGGCIVRDSKGERIDPETLRKQEHNAPGIPWSANYPWQEAPKMPLPGVKDHEIAQLVNRLRDIAIEFHGHQSLRDRIAREVIQVIRGR